MPTAFFALLAVQIALGALDNLLHHELTEKLPARVSARTELALHAARELLYGVIFLALAWTHLHGVWAWALAAILAIEAIVTMWDFVEEDRTRTLPPLERVLHTILALNFGAMLAVAAPTWALWAGLPTALAPANHGLIAWLLTACALGVAAWGVRDAIAALALRKRARSVEERPAPSGRTILITGATGFLGEALTRRRLARGDAIIVLSRDPKRAQALFDGAALAVDSLDCIPATCRIDAIVNLAGAGVANAPWTARRKRALLASRLAVTEEAGRLVARLEQKPHAFVSASAVGFYGDRGEALLTESAAPGAGFTSRLCAQWEAAAALAAQGVARKVTLRFGLVFGRDGGAWPRLALPMLARLAVAFGDGRQWMAWIHKEDALGLLEAALDDDRLRGPVNAVAPTETRHGACIAAIAEAGGAFARLSVPAWLLRAGLGEMAHLFLDSQRVVPRAAIAAGYAFRYPTIAEAARDLLDQPTIMTQETAATGSTF